MTDVTFKQEEVQCLSFDTNPEPLEMRFITPTVRFRYNQSNFYFLPEGDPIHFTMSYDEGEINYIRTLEAQVADLEAQLAVWEAGGA